MNTQITRLEYEVPKLEVQLLLPQVYVLAVTCVSSPTDGAVCDPGDDV